MKDFIHFILAISKICASLFAILLPVFLLYLKCRVNSLQKQLDELNAKINPPAQPKKMDFNSGMPYR